MPWDAGIFDAEGVVEDEIVFEYFAAKLWREI